MNESKTPWTIDGSMPLPVMPDDTVRRADVLSIWNQWRLALSSLAAFQHCDGIAFLQALRDLEGSPLTISQPPQPTIREAWEAGFKLCRSYGDNHWHWDGEQKEQRWREYLDGVNPIQPLAEVASPPPQPPRELAEQIVRFLRSDELDGGTNLTTEEAVDRIVDVYFQVVSPPPTQERKQL